MLDLNMFLYLIFSIIILWIATLKIIEKRRVIEFLPFVLVSLLASFSSSFIFFNFFNSFIWGFLEFSYFVVFVLIFINLWRKKCLT